MTDSINYHRVEGAEPERLLELAAEIDRIDDAEVISEGRGEFVFQTVTEASLSQFALRAPTRSYCRL